MQIGAKMMSVTKKIFNSPRLGISNVVHSRRINSHSRVEYLLDPEGYEDLGYAIPEKLVLYRWRQRTNQKYCFNGMRLSPNIWRSINVALGPNYFEVFKMTADQIHTKYSKASQSIKTLNYPTLAGIKVVRLMEGLGLDKFNILMQRHNDLSRIKQYGTPDLFLWAVAKRSDKIAYSRFVEVKKPEEPLSQDQIDELYFLRCRLHIKSRCFRLKERHSLSPKHLISPLFRPI